MRDLDLAEVAGSSAMEWCAIVYKRLRRQAEFHVVVIEKGGSRRYVAGSPTFRAPTFGAVRRRAGARAAHELLVSRLEACGWRAVDGGGAWHELGFVRPIVEGVPRVRALVSVVRKNGQAQFAAEEFDAYGNPTPLAMSDPFPAQRRRSVPRTEQAEAAHEELLQRLKSDGWNVVGPAGPEWFLVALERPTEVGGRSHEAQTLSPRAVDEGPTASNRRPIAEEARRELPRRDRPDVPALLEHGDVEGLVQAAGFVEGGPVDECIRIREQAILALGELGPDVGSEAVADGLRDSSDRVGSAAVQVLHSRGEIELLASALGSLPPTSEKSRELAFQAILEHRSSRVVRAATRTLVRSPGDAPLSDQDAAFLRSLAGSEGGREPAEVVVRELLEALSDDRTEVADRAEDLLVGLAPASTTGLIAELKTHRSPERAATALGRIGDSSAMQPLIDALERSDAGVRLQAAAALGALRDPAAVESLLRATRDSDLDVRAEASHALDHLGAAGVIVGMSALLRSMVMEAVASVADLPPPDHAGRVVPQISAQSWDFSNPHEATQPPKDSP